MPKFTHIQYMNTFIVSLVCKQYFYTKTCCFFLLLKRNYLSIQLARTIENEKSVVLLENFLVIRAF